LITNEETTLLTGQIRTWKFDKNYGFIGDDTDTPDMFVHGSSLVGIPHPSIGLRVTYEIAQNPKNGRDQAVNVTLLDKGEAEVEKAWASKPVQPDDISY
jgi:cold shock CspA family protein